MSSDTIICLGVIIGLCIADLAARYYLAKKQKDEGVKLDPVDMLKDFSEVLNEISSECIKVCLIDPTQENYKELLATEILKEFKHDLEKHFSGTQTYIAINSLSDEFMINFIVNNILSKPYILEKIKNTSINETSTTDILKHIDDANS